MQNTWIRPSLTVTPSRRAYAKCRKKHHCAASFGRCIRFCSLRSGSSLIPRISLLSSFQPLALLPVAPAVSLSLSPSLSPGLPSRQYGTGGGLSPLPVPPPSLVHEKGVPAVLPLLPDQGRWRALTSYRSQIEPSRRARCELQPLRRRQVATAVTSSPPR
jgi:hypothetical protein